MVQLRYLSLVAPCSVCGIDRSGWPVDRYRGQLTENAFYEGWWGQPS